MRSPERRGIRESLEHAVSFIARAYGFKNSPLPIPQKDLGDASEETEGTFLVATLKGKMGSTDTTTQAWGVLRSKGNSRIIFAVQNPKHAIAQAFVIKASLATAEAAGFTNCTVHLTSVGDQESRRRYLRELGNFFRKHKDAPDEVRERSAHDPDGAALLLTAAEHPLKDSLPRTIDYLSEPSRKIMLETITLLEALGIQYELDPRLPFTPDMNRELVFAITGTNKKGERVRVATGGRLEEDKKSGQSIVGISVSVPDTLDARDFANDFGPACFVVHVGEAAKIKAFGLVDALLASNVALDQALLAPTIQEQMRLAQESGAKFVAIIGQREALDGTAIVRNVSTQIAETLTLDRAVSRLARIRS